MNVRGSTYDEYFGQKMFAIGSKVKERWFGMGVASSPYLYCFTLLTQSPDSNTCCTCCKH